MSFPDAFADVVISSAVLHFAINDEHFRAMLLGTWRVLKPGGLLFCRLASSIGIENQISNIAGRRFLLPDGSERYLVDEKLLCDLTKELGGQMLDPSENDGGAESTLDDHVGGAKDRPLAEAFSSTLMEHLQAKPPAHTTCNCCCGAGGSAGVYVQNFCGLSLFRNPGLPRDVSIQPFVHRNVIHFQRLAQRLIQSRPRVRIR